MKINCKKWWWVGIPTGVSIVMGCYLASKVAKPGSWELADRDISIKVLAENSQNLMEAKDSTEITSNVRWKAFTPSGAPTITIYNFNTKRLCGVGGCLHSIYQKDKLLFRVLLNKESGITTQDNCLVISQENMRKTSTRTTTSVLKYCYQNSNYVQSPISYR